MRDNAENQSDVAYESAGDKEAKSVTLPNKQFPGDKMPQDSPTRRKTTTRTKYNARKYKENR